MPKIKEHVKKAIAKAEKEARKSVLKPKKKQKKTDFSRLYKDMGINPKIVKSIEKEEEQKQQTNARWVKDEWGNQGEVFFDGYNYWGVAFERSQIDKSIANAHSIRWTPKEWEERKTGEVKNVGHKPSGRGMERRAASRTTKHHKSSTKPSGKRGKATNRKVRASKGVSLPKRPRLAKVTRGNGKKVRKNRRITKKAKK